MAIAKEIVERHQGQIEVESTGVMGEGTIFTIWLPKMDTSSPQQLQGESE